MSLLSKSVLKLVVLALLTAALIAMKPVQANAFTCLSTCLANFQACSRSCGLNSACLQLCGNKYNACRAGC